MKRKLLLSAALLSLGLALAWGIPARDDSRSVQLATTALAAKEREHCGTKHIDEATAAQYQAKLNDFNSRRSAGQSGRRSHVVHSALRMPIARRMSRLRFADAW